jgi:hypothetical protein
MWCGRCRSADGGCLPKPAKSIGFLCITFRRQFTINSLALSKRWLIQSEVDGYRNPTKSGGWRSIPYHSARSGKQPFQPWLCRTTNHRCRPVRFLADGPAISDELLVARDEGRVIFFCGAGVSRARAGLADFFGLARQVLDVLEPNPEARTRKLLEAAIRVQDETGISGLVPADRIFGLLEQDFNVGDIQRPSLRHSSRFQGRTYRHTARYWSWRWDLMAMSVW